MMGESIMKSCRINRVSHIKSLLMCMCLLFASIAMAEDYVIGDGDTLNISVWGEPALSTPATVRPDGKITLQAVGDVSASGFTPAKLSEKLTKEFTSVVNKPIVTVTVTGITNNKIYVFGGGVPSGINNLQGRTTLLKFLIRFGTLKGADLEHSYVLREGKKLDVNFYDLLIKGDMTKDIMLYPEDIIYIPDNEPNKIYVMGAVNTPKLVMYREGIKILDALLEAGGFTKFAKENSVIILRKGVKDNIEILVKAKDLMKDGELTQNVTLMPGDFIIVKESIF